MFRQKSRASKAENKKMVGAYVPRHLHNYITLYCLLHEKAKSSIMEEALQNWHQKAIYEKSESQIIEELRNEVQKGWFIRSKQSNCIFEDFIKEITDFFRLRDIDEKYIKQIININEKDSEGEKPIIKTG
ncbi:MAG: hypothetical protein ACLFVR_14970 [Thiohalospira sp.]